MHKASLTKSEVEKVTHDINNLWHTRYQGLELGVIYTHSNNTNAPAYAYTFINYGFNDYLFIDKKPIN